MTYPGLFVMFQGVFGLFNAVHDGGRIAAHVFAYLAHGVLTQQVSGDPVG